MSDYQHVGQARPRAYEWVAQSGSIAARQLLAIIYLMIT